MNATELIAILVGLRSKYGDIPVVFMGDDKHYDIQAGGYYLTATTTEGNKPFVGIKTKGVKKWRVE